MSAIYANHLIMQIQHSMRQMQRSIVSNAEAHRAMALSRNPPLETLQTFWRDATSEYLRHLYEVLNARTGEHGNNISAALSRFGLSHNDVDAVLTPLMACVSDMQTANISNYEDIVMACEKVLADVKMPPSVWPE